MHNRGEMAPISEHITGVVPMTRGLVLRGGIADYKLHSPALFIRDPAAVGRLRKEV